MNKELKQEQQQKSKWRIIKQTSVELNTLQNWTHELYNRICKHLWMKREKLWMK